jgi:hypothetical protein
LDIGFAVEDIGIGADEAKAHAGAVGVVLGGRGAAGWVVAGCG